MTTDFTRLFVDVDDCWKAFEKMYAKHLIEDGTRKRNRQGNLSTSEIMTILIAFQTSGYRTFKDFYQYLFVHHRHDFPDMVSYDRFVYLIPRAIIPLSICRPIAWISPQAFLLLTVLLLKSVIISVSIAIVFSTASPK
jgi:hypothetical protein